MISALGARSLAAVCAAFLAASCGQPSSSTPLGRRPTGSHSYNGPDLTKTPGSLCDLQNPDFDGYRYGEGIIHCRRNVSTPTKAQIAASYGVEPDQRGDYEIDHFIPLNIGGNNAHTNLWPLWGPLAREKSVFEQQNMDRVACGEITQAQAIAAIRAWRSTSDRY